MQTKLESRPYDKRRKIKDDANLVQNSNILHLKTLQISKNILILLKHKQVSLMNIII